MCIRDRDEALALPSEDAAELALRIQQIIALESGITSYPDPFGGSYVIEELTENFYKEAMLIINEIDDLGGAITAVENGYIENEITRSAYEYQKQVEEKERLVVGVNVHEKEDLSEQLIQNIDSKKVDIHIKRLKDLKKKRNNLEVQSSLDTLKRAAKTDENVMPQIINCVRSKCTLGEISDVLRKVYGEY